MTVITTVEIDCHEHPWWEEPGGVVGLAERYGILLRYLPDHEWADWAWWWEITGPVEHLIRFLMEEWGADEEMAREIVEGSWRD